MSLNADERETVINATDADDVIRIWTAQPRYLGQLRRNPNFTETKSGHYGTTAWAEFTIPADRWTPASGVKRTMNLTDEEREVRRNRALASFGKSHVASTGQPVSGVPGNETPSEDSTTP